MPGSSKNAVGKAIAAGVLLLMPASSCGVGQIEKRLDSVQARLEEIAAASRTSQARLSSLEGRVLLLQDEVETLRMASRRSDGRTPVPTPSPPKDLPVVRVTPPEERSTASASAFAFDENMYQEIDDEGNVRPAPKERRQASSQERSASENRRLTPKQSKQQKEDAVIEEYNTAMELYRQGRMVEARAAFDAFAKRYPRHSYADNARYWAGECLYAQGDYEGAKREFMRVITEHPDGNKVPDAMVKVGLCDKALGRHEDAMRMFRTVMLTYPESEAAALAMRLAGEGP